METKTFLTRWGRGAWRVATALTLAGTTACSDMFDVEDPQAFGDSDLNDPAILKSVADGAEGLLHQGWDDFVVVTSLLGDEVESTSTWIDWEDISEGRVRADWPTVGSFSDPQNQILRARFAAQSAGERFKGLQNVPAVLNVQVAWVDAFADVIVGMGWCEGPLQQGSARAPNSQFFSQAVSKLNAVLTAANALPAGAARTTWVNNTLAARARANLFAGNFDAAAADAAQIPAGFRKDAVFSIATGAQQSTMGNQFHQNRNRSGGLRRMYHSRVLGTFGSTATTGFIADWVDATKPDPRMAVTRVAGQLGVNNRFAYFGITKYNDNATDIPMLKKDEMVLIEAEVAFRKNDFAGMAARLNTLRAAAGLAAMPTPTTQAAAQTALLNERMAVMFVEGHRAFDLFRFGQTRAVLGAGRATLLPLSRTEILNNKNMKEGDGRCPTVT